MIKPDGEASDALGQSTFNPRDERSADEYAKSAEVIKAYISPTPGDRRISRSRGTGFDYITITHHAVTSCKSVEKGMYLRETDLFIIMGADSRAAVRKDSDFIASKQGEILYSGQFGTICGVPVLYSRKVTGGKMYITNKEAIKFFVKKEATVEQDRNIETKDNTVVYERHGIVALVDDTSSVILKKA